LWFGVDEMVGSPGVIAAVLGSVRLICGSEFWIYVHVGAVSSPGGRALGCQHTSPCAMIQWAVSIGRTV